MKKIFATSLLTALLLTNCGGSSTSTDVSSEDSETPRYITYRTSDFSIDVPDTWKTVNTFTENYPSDLRIAFKNNIQDATFTANVTVLREDNPKELTSADFTQQKLSDHTDHLLNYSLISQDEITLTVSGADSATILNTFSGKNTTSGPTLEFMQVVLTKADKAWTVTASYRDDEDAFTVEKMQTMLNSFAVR